jgi:hypothetical protein
MSYNPRRNRDCPKCSVLAKTNCLERQKEAFIVAQLVSCVFIIDHTCNRIACTNQRAVYDLLS